MTIRKSGKLSDEHLQWHCLHHTNANECASECYLQRIFALLGKKHTLAIIRLLLLHEKIRFNEIVKEIGKSPKTITDRLRELEAHGLLVRQVFNEIPMRVEYSLTEPGKDMANIFERLSIWIGTWMKK